MRSRAAARGAARAAKNASSSSSSMRSTGGAKVSVSSARDAAAGLKSLADARAAAGRSSVPSSPADLRRYQEEEANAQADLMQMGYSPEFVNQVSTFWQGLAQLPKEQQDRIMSQLQQQANSTVDYGFDAEQSYLKALREAKQKNYDEELALFRKAEEDDLKKILGDTSRGASEQLQSAYAGLAQNRSFDSGQMGSIAARAIEEYMRQINDAQTTSKNSLDQAQQKRDSASNLLSIQAEQDLADIMNRRTAARSQRLSQLIGLNASQQLLAQVPTANQITIPTSTAKATTQRSTTTPVSLPSMDVGGYRSTSYGPNTANNVAARKSARLQKNQLISNY